MRRHVAYRVGNVQRIGENAIRKLGDAAETEGSVPARVGLRLFEEGSYSDDELVVEYLGGVLASSRTPMGRDDRGITWLSLVSRLSTYELRSHYVFYSVARSLLLPLEHDDKTPRQMSFSTSSIFMPYDSYHQAMGFTEDEDWFVLFTHALYGLHREGLIGDAFAYGTPEHLNAANPGLNIESDGLIFSPSRSGIGLLLWGVGKGQHGLGPFFDPAEDLSLMDTEIIIPEGSIIAEYGTGFAKPEE